jgi:pyrimidine operon attenuation protein / uracil phosphoribosyltransferase
MTPAATDRTEVLDARAIARALSRMAVEMVEQSGGGGHLVLVGIQRRGAELAERIGRVIEKEEGAPVARGAMDITLYRDDLSTVGPRPLVGETHLPPEIEGGHVFVVDDVLYTGRTVRAALDEIADFGRPRKISLAVLIDRGGRELPIEANVIGKTLKVPPQDRVDVLLQEVDGRDAVELVRMGNT